MSGPAPSSALNRLGWVCAALACAALAAVLFAQGSSQPRYQGSPLPNPEYVAMLREKAEALAESELRAFNEIEAQYKTVVRQHPQPKNPMNPAGLYTKCYREFTDAQVLDIYRSESLVYPVTYRIRFSFNLYATERVHVELEGARERAEAATEFELIQTSWVDRRYPCSLDGTYSGGLLPAPPHHNYFGGEFAVPPSPGEPAPNPVPPAIEVLLGGAP